MKKSNKLIIFCVLIFCISVLLFIPTLKHINYGIDLQGGFEILYKVEPLVEGEEITETDLNKTYDAIVKRIDTLGVSEPIITFESGNILRIQLPGVKNEKEAREMISTIALLSFRDTSDNVLMTSEILGNNGASKDTDSETLLPVVKLDIKDTDKFYKVTKSISESADNRIVIWLDFEDTDSFEKEKSTCGEDSNDKCLSAAYVEEGLNSSTVVIRGNFTTEKVNRLVDLINAGSLPTKLVEDSAPHSVSASFGEHTISSAGYAGLVSLIIISLILITKYRISGLISSICLIVYSVLVFIIFDALGGVLTLPGIAALILGIGMSVDSAIILIERIKDEYKNNLSDAFKLGSKKSLIAIIDANITTFIVAFVLYIFGESSIKGFATMLIISIFVTALSMIILNRYLISLAVSSKKFDNNFNLLFGKLKAKKSYNFVKINKYALIIFVLILLSGVFFGIKNGINLGIDFSGGTNINMISDDTINFDNIIPLVEKYSVEDYNYYMNSNNEGYIKLNQIINDEDMNDLTIKFKDLNIETSINEISTLVTNKLTTNALYSLLIAFVAIIIYIAIRFDFNFGISSLLALMHDVILIIVVFIIFKLEFNFIIVAALLTIIGYSINDTIVVFDRIRDNKRVNYNNIIKSKEELKNLMNESMSDVFIRNILTSLTTIIAVVVLIAFKINGILNFNIAILVGLVGGSISSILFAPNLWRILEEKNIGKKSKKKKEYDEIDEMSIKGVNS